MSARNAMAALGVMLAACTGGEMPDANEADDVEAREGPSSDGPPGHGDHGPRMLASALAEVDMTDEERARVDALLAPTEEDGAEHDRGFDRVQMRVRHEALVEAVRSGNEADLERATTAMSPPRDRRDRFVSVLNQLHATLSPEQRHALVVAIRSQREEHGDSERSHRRHGEGRSRGEGHGPDRLLEDLRLTDEQRARFDAARARTGEAEGPQGRGARHEGRRAHFEAMLAAFEQDDFDAARVLPGGEHGGPMARHAQDLRVLVPILTPEQREALADRMEARFERGPRGGHRDGPREGPGQEGR